MAASLSVGASEVAAALVLAAATAYLALRSSRRFIVIATCLALLPVPLLLPESERLARFVAAVLCAGAIAKFHDVARSVTPFPSAKRFVTFLLNPTTMVLRRADDEPRPALAVNVQRIVFGLCAGALGAAGVVGVHRLAQAHPGFLLEHVAKLVFGYVCAFGLLAALVAVNRLTLGPSRDFMHNIFTPPTPAELWRRYNRPVGQYLFENVFKTTGGRKHPVRATLLVFLFSAVLHEYVFGVAIGSVQGFQTAFFGLQGLGVAATLRARPKGAARVASTALTFAFNVATSLLFMASVNQIVPFWTSAPFGWPNAP
jgi:MBOAT, membrane-bound O-acyltransferase family